MLTPLLHRLHLRHLSLLMAIGNKGSLNRAAPVVGLTQPGATKSLLEIEDALGQKLFVRSTKGLVPTEAGHCALRYASAITAQLTNLSNELNHISSGAGGQIRVGTIMGAVPFLTELLVRFIDRYPHVSIEFVEDTSAELLALLDRGALDLVIGRSTVSEQPERYESVPVRQETLAVVANERHRCASSKRISLTDLVDSRWIVYSANMPMRLLLEREFAQAGLLFPRDLVETSSVFATLSLIQKSRDFVVLVSSDVAAFCSNFGLAVTLPLDLYSYSEPYELITLRGAHISPPAKRFIEEFLDGMSRPQAGEAEAAEREVVGQAIRSALPAS